MVNLRHDNEDMISDIQLQTLVYIFIHNGINKSIVNFLHAQTQIHFSFFFINLKTKQTI